MDNFQYAPLDAETSSFRLLSLPRGDTIELECEIFHASIDGPDAVPYEALSYTWGSGELLNSIQVDRKTFWITENLYAALHSLRSRDKDRILWIDAICIDQSNLEERSRQVQKMGTIFASADRVIFWLGKPTADATLLMHSLNELQVKAEGLVCQGMDADDCPWEDLWSEIELSRTNHHDLASKHREGLQALLKRPWFRRVWILQEVAKAQSAIICAGTHHVPAHIFALIPEILNVPTEPRVQSVLDIVPGPTRITSWWGRERGLFHLLGKFGESEATDKRDMIFALLGMSSDSPDHILLRADYTKSLPEVLHDAVRYWFEICSTPVRHVFEVLKTFKTIRVIYFASWEPFRPEHTKIAMKYKLQEVLENVGHASSILIEPLDEYSSIYKYLESRDRTRRHRQWEKDLKSWDGIDQKAMSIMQRRGETLDDPQESDCTKVLEVIVDWNTSDKQDLLFQMLRETLTLHPSKPDLVKCLLVKGADANAPGVGGNEALVYASGAGDLEILRLLLDVGGMDVNIVGGEYGNALQAACKYNRKDVVQVLLDKAANINMIGGMYGTALQAACVSKNTEIIQLLLTAGADVNAVGGYYGTALQAASYQGQMNIVQVLLNRSADVNVRGGIYGTALHGACAAYKEDIVQTLIDRGADVNAQGRIGKDTPLEMALRLECKVITKILVKAGASVRGRRLQLMKMKIYV